MVRSCNSSLYLVEPVSGLLKTKSTPKIIPEIFETFSLINYCSIILPMSDTSKHVRFFVRWTSKGYMSVILTAHVSRKLI